MSMHLVALSTQIQIHHSNRS